MAFTTREAHEQIVAELGWAVGQIALASETLSDAYERLDVTTADRLEDELYRPLQRSFGRAKRTLVQFAGKVGIEPSEGEPDETNLGRLTVKQTIERAVALAADGGQRIAELQDSDMAIAAGDAELRAGLAETRRLLGELSSRAPGLPQDPRPLARPASLRSSESRPPSWLRRRLVRRRRHVRGGRLARAADALGDVEADAECRGRRGADHRHAAARAARLERLDDLVGGVANAAGRVGRLAARGLETASCLVERGALAGERVAGHRRPPCSREKAPFLSAIPERPRGETSAGRRRPSDGPL